MNAERDCVKATYTQIAICEQAKVTQPTLFHCQ